jgi:histidine triad (HIT) family protein
MCLFCKIAQKEIPSTIVYEDEEVIAFRDIAPQAPVHILIIPKKHISALAVTSDSDFNLIGKLLQVAKQLAAQEKIDRSGYRLVLNNGRAAGQAVDHILSSLGWTRFYLASGIEYLLDVS